MVIIFSIHILLVTLKTNTNTINVHYIIHFTIYFKFIIFDYSFIERIYC